MTRYCATTQAFSKPLAKRDPWALGYFIGRNKIIALELLLISGTHKTESNLHCVSTKPAYASVFHYFSGGIACRIKLKSLPLRNKVAGNF